MVAIECRDRPLSPEAFPSARVISTGRGQLDVHTLKLSPQEQLALAFGLENLKPPATSAEE
ncbi:MAG: hypothetical protein RLZZ221_1052 [Verrucomicrobiota bacterium]